MILYDYDFKVGDQVDIIGKSVGSNWSTVYGNYEKCGKAYITKWKYEFGVDLLVVDNDPTSDTGDYFLPKDLKHVYNVAKEIDGMFQDLLQEI